VGFWEVHEGRAFERQPPSTLTPLTPPPTLPPLPITLFFSPPQTGDIVEVVANSMIHKGMPHKTYHGRTGIVFNVAKRAVGVEVSCLGRLLLSVCVGGCTFPPCPGGTSCPYLHLLTPHPPLSHTLLTTEQIKKVVRNRVEMKRINVRIEHVRPSKCRSDFLSRVKKVDTILREAKAKGEKAPASLIRRAPTAPKAGFSVPRASIIKATVTSLKPALFDDML